jgi:hypothetical protein
VRTPTTITGMTRSGRTGRRLSSLSPERRRVVALVGLVAVGLVFLGWRHLRKRPDPRQGTIAIAYRLVATSDDGQPLADVALSVNGKVVARTDASGEATLPLRGRLGTVVPLTVACPAGHTGTPTVPPIVMRPHRALKPAADKSAPVAAAPAPAPAPAAAPAPATATPPAPATTTPSATAKANAKAKAPVQALEASVVCDRGVRRAAVLVLVQVETTTTHRDAKGRTTEKVSVAPLAADILVDGAPVAVTERGVAHLALERAPGSKVELEVTPASAALDPFELPFEVADTDDVYVFERTISQRVATADEPRKRKRARKAEKRAPRIRAIQRSDEPFLDL